MKIGAKILRAQNSVLAKIAYSIVPADSVLRADLTWDVGSLIILRVCTTSGPYMVKL